MPGRWIAVRGIVVRGHGIASGRAPDTPYPAGSIALQRPHFAARGLDLADLFDGTVNLDLAPRQWRPAAAELTLRDVAWTPLIPPETFSFIPCRASIVGEPSVYAGFVYYPHPETKPGHHQPGSVLELLLPHLEDLRPGTILDVQLPAEQVELDDSPGSA
jgi:hypothetical protein